MVLQDAPAFTRHCIAFCLIGLLLFYRAGSGAG